MNSTPLSEPWKSLALAWVPRLLAAWSADGWPVGSPAGETAHAVETHVRLMGLPAKPQVAEGVAYVALGPLVVATRHPVLLAFLAGEPVDLGEARVSFPDPWPEVSGIPGGLRVVWRTPALVHGFLARAIGVRLAEVRLYPRSAVLVLENAPDKTLTW